MNIKSKYRKQIVTVFAVTVLAMGLTGCSNDKKEASEDKEVVQEVKGNTSEKKQISTEEASRVLYDKLGDSELWWTFVDEWEDYYTFEETSVGADFRYLVNKYTGEVFYESALPDMIGNLIPFDEVESESMHVGPKPVQLVNNLKPKLKKMDTLQQAKSELSLKIQSLLKKHKFKVTDATEVNDFVISNTTYNKFTEDYNQLMYYLFTEDFSKGTADLNIYLSQEIHSDYKLNKDDNFVKLLYDMYIYLTSSKISIDEFANILQKQHEEGGSATELTENYLGLTINNEFLYGSRKKLTMSLSVELEDLIKSKYYKNEYSTVAEYKETSEKIKKEIKNIDSKYQTKQGDPMTSYGYGLDSYNILNAEYKYGKSKFMQTGRINLTPEVANTLFRKSGTDLTPEEVTNALFSKSEIDTLNNVLKLALGESVYEKIDKTTLTVENLNKVYKSNAIKSNYAKIIATTNNNIKNEQLYHTYININNAKMYSADTRFYIEFSVPVIAEGIRGV